MKVSWKFCDDDHYKHDESLDALVDVGEDDNDNEDVDVKPETRQRRLMFLPSSSAKDVSTIVCCLGGVMTIMKKGMKRIMSHTF